MDRIWIWIKKYLFIEGLAVGALMCHFVYKEYRIDEIKDTHEAKEQASNLLVAQKENELKEVSEKLAKKEDYEQKYVAESTRAALVDKKRADLQVDFEGVSRRYAELLSMKWEEKYNIEKLSRIAREEELSALRIRLSSAQSSQATANPQLLTQIDDLKKQLEILGKERNELRSLYANLPFDISNTNKSTLIISDYRQNFDLLLKQRQKTLARLFETKKQLLAFLSMGFNNTTNKQSFSSDGIQELLKSFMIGLMYSIRLYESAVVETYSSEIAMLCESSSKPLPEFKELIPTVNNGLVVMENLISQLAVSGLEAKGFNADIFKLVEKTVTDYETSRAASVNDSSPTNNVNTIKHN